MRSATWDEEAEGEIVEAEGDTYAVVNRSRRWFVVNRATGRVASGGDHGRDKTSALEHFNSLEMSLLPGAGE